MIISLKKIYNFLLQSNLFIAFAATCFTLQTQVQLGTDLKWHPYLLLVFFSSFLGYNFYRLVVLFTKPSLLLHYPKYQWLKEKLNYFYGLICIAILGLIITAFFAKETVLLLLFPLGIITLLYTLPLFNIKQRAFRIREFPLAKIFIIAFVWAVSTILPPIIQSQQMFHAAVLFELIIERFLFIIAITIPFDIRDMDSDKQIKLKTIPIIMGERKALVLSNLLLILFAILSFLNNFFNHSLYIFYGLFLSIIITLICINDKRIKQWANYYYSVLDGMIIVQALLVIFSRFIYNYLISYQ